MFCNDWIDSGNEKFKKLINVAICYLKNCIPVCIEQNSFYVIFIEFFKVLMIYFTVCWVSLFKYCSRRNWAQWSEIVLIIFPDILPSLILLGKILSIRVLEQGVTREGVLMWGKRKLAYIESKNFAEYFSVSYFQRSILKSFIITIVLFSFERFLRRSFKYISLNSCGCMHRYLLCIQQ